MTYNEKKSLYESIMKDVAKSVKRQINENGVLDINSIKRDPRFKNAVNALYSAMTNTDNIDICEKSLRITNALSHAIAFEDEKAIELLYESLKKHMWIILKSNCFIVTLSQWFLEHINESRWLIHFASVPAIYFFVYVTLQVLLWYRMISTEHHLLEVTPEAFYSVSEHVAENEFVFVMTNVVVSIVFFLQTNIWSRLICIDDGCSLWWTVWW